MADASFEDLRGRLQGLWQNPGEIEGYLSAVRASDLSAEEVGRLLDALPAAHPDSPVGRACGRLTRGLERIRDDRLRRAEHREAHEPTRSGRPIVFISCGQYTEDERALGRTIIALVDQLTPFEPYFADAVSDLEGLTRSIFGRLNTAAGFICVMHHRGRVNTPDGEVVRASVWIEQEIAIAAFLRQTLGRELKVAAFAQEGIHLEGVRAQLHLNPTRFRTNDEVVDRLRTLLPTWVLERPSDETSGVLLVPEIRTERAGKERRASILLRNAGTVPVYDFRVEIRIPRGLIHPRTGLGGEDPKLGTDTQRGVLRTHRHFLPAQLPIYPGRELMVYGPPLSVNETAWLRRSEIGGQRLEATVLSTGMQPQTVSMTADELGLADFQPPAPIEVANPSRPEDRAVQEFIEAQRRVGVTPRWRRESEVGDVDADGRPYCFVRDRRVITHGNRNRNNRDLPPEYLVYE